MFPLRRDYYRHIFRRHPDPGRDSIDECINAADGVVARRDANVLTALRVNFYRPSRFNRFNGIFIFLPQDYARRKSNDMPSRSIEKQVAVGETGRFRSGRPLSNRRVVHEPAIKVSSLRLSGRGRAVSTAGR